jgi:hypothetical protein
MKSFFGASPASLASRALTVLATIGAIAAIAPFAAPQAARAALCDDTYALQSAAQTLFTGSNPKSLARTAKFLKPDFSDLTPLHPLMAYDILTGFEGACAKASRPVHFLSRPASAAGFSPRTDNGYQVVMYDTNTVLEHTRFGYWFAFYKPADTLQLMAGRIKGEGTDFRSWYAYVTFEDSVRNPESGLWTAKGTQLRMAGPSDSAVLDSILMKRTGYRDLVFDQNRRGHFQLQFIRVSLENKPGIAIRRRAPPAGGGSGIDTERKTRGFLVNGSEIKAGKIPAPAAPNGTRRYIVESGR